MQIVMFNTVMGVFAGLALLLVPRYWAALRGDHLPLRIVTHPAEGTAWAAAFGILGILLTGLGSVMTVTHPVAPAKPYITNILGDSSLMLGVILLAAAWHLGRRDDTARDAARLQTILTLLNWIICALGVVLLWCTLAILRLDVISSAPIEEPITGLLHRYPAVENTFFALVLYGPAALGCLIFPAAIKAQHRNTWLTLYWCWTISGFGFATFSAMNFYTHTGMLTNTADPGPDLRW